MADTPPGTMPATLPNAVDWPHVQPVSTLSVHPLAATDAPAPYRGRRGLFVIEGKVIDARSGRTLMEPHLIAVRGESSTIEVGDVAQVRMRLTVTIATDDRSASTTTELRNAAGTIGMSTLGLSLD